MKTFIHHDFGKLERDTSDKLKGSRNPPNQYEDIYTS
jgi:hypothetical protein